MEEWRYMKEFAFDLIKFSRTIRDEDDITKQRVTIILLDQSLELLMKSYILKNSILNRDEIKGVKFYAILGLIKNLSEPLKEEIKHFHWLRNEIQHRALELNEINKPREIIKFCSALEEIYAIIFSDNELPSYFGNRND